MTTPKTINLKGMDKKTRADWIAYCNYKGYKYIIN